MFAHENEMLILSLLFKDAGDEAAAGSMAS
jgi:hypothetical protein